MNFLVDANVLSELTKPVPQQSVVSWLRENESEIAIDPIILGEIRFGIYLLPTGRRRQRLEKWFQDGIVRLLCVSWDAETGLRWAQLLAELRRRGLAMPIKDSMIAASALRHGLTIVTRNVADFKMAGARVVNPFA